MEKSDLRALGTAMCLGTSVLASCSPGRDAPAAFADTVAPTPTVPAVTAAQRAGDDTLYGEAAAAAWRFVDRNYVPATGLVKPFDHYAIATMWDVASGIAALVAARELGFLEQGEYVARVQRALRTLETLVLFEEVGFNKEYEVTSGLPIGLQRTPDRTGYGISATDHGRLLLWLRIVAARTPELAPAVHRVVGRLDLRRFEEDGYLVGRQLSRRTGSSREFQEGRIGYEQYAARGFSLWGLDAEGALDIQRNARDRRVSGVTVPADKRGGDRLTSEPFVLLGIEAGWRPAERVVAERLLEAQEARHRATDTLTLVSEDAINTPPHYFYYYTVLSPHGAWTVDVQRPNTRVDGPRWVSAKAAFAWHALLPRRYTRLVLDTVQGAALRNGVWSSGVLENGRSTATPNVNTAAVILESALYRVNGAPLLQVSR